jgi:hypothetical protein
MTRSKYLSNAQLQNARTYIYFFLYMHPCLCMYIYVYIIYIYICVYVCVLSTYASQFFIFRTSVSLAKIKVASLCNNSRGILNIV